MSMDAITVRPFEEVAVNGCRFDGPDNITACDDTEAQFWTVYVKRGGMSEAVIDVPTRALAELIQNALTALTPGSMNARALVQMLQQQPLFYEVSLNAALLANGGRAVIDWEGEDDSLMVHNGAEVAVLGLVSIAPPTYRVQLRPGVEFNVPAAQLHAV